MSTDVFTTSDGNTCPLTKFRNSSRKVFTLAGRCRICTGVVLGEAPKSFVPYVFFSRRILRVVFLCEGIKLDACLFCPSFFQLRFIVFQAATLNTCFRARVCHVPKRTLSGRLANMLYLPCKYCKLNMTENEPFSSSNACSASQESSGVSPDTTNNSLLGTPNERDLRIMRATAQLRDRQRSKKALASGHKTKRFKHVMSPTGVHMKPFSGCV